MAKQGSKAKRRITKGYIDFLSLCPKGANTIQTVYKTEDGHDKNISFTTLSKELSEQGELIACVYSPDLVDSQGDVASAKVIKQMAYDFAVAGMGIDIRHNNQVIPKSEAFIAQSFIIQKGDPRFSDMKNYDGKAVDVTDGWGVVIKIEDDRLKELYKSGMWGGISMGGFMVTDDGAFDDADKSLVQTIKEFIVEFRKDKTKPNDTETDMTPEQIATMKKEITDSVVLAVKESLKPAQETEVEKTARLAKEAESKASLGMGLPKPVLKEGATEAEIDRFAKEMEIYELSKSVDRTSLPSVREFQKMVKEIVTGKADATVVLNKNNPYGGFFKTNQDVAADTGKKLDISSMILADIEKEEKEKK